MRIELKTKDEELVEIVDIKDGEVFTTSYNSEFLMVMKGDDEGDVLDRVNAVNIETGEVVYFAESKKVNVKVTVYHKEQ